MSVELGPEHLLLVRDMVAARKESGMTQKQVAEIMKTKPPQITRLESGNSSFSVAMLRRYAKAIGYKVMFIWVPLNETE